jgi:hypothetical protein
VREFSAESVFQDPCLSYTLRDVICSYCSTCRYAYNTGRARVCMFVRWLAGLSPRLRSVCSRAMMLRTCQRRGWEDLFWLHTQ